MTANKIIEPISNHLQNFNQYFDEILGSEIKIIEEISSHHKLGRGKMMRPALVFLAAELNGGVNEKTYAGAAIVELLHNAAIVHDDIIDNSEMRRGLQTINAKWDNPTALLYGDYLLSLAFKIAASTGLIEFVRIISDVFKTMCEGELQQKVRIRDISTQETDYLNIIHNKTAELMSACCEIGAISSNNDKETIDRLAEFGRYLGIAYQIHDDIMDYQYDTSITGKSRYNDIKEKKMTLPLIHSFKSIGVNNEIAALVKNGKLSDSEVEKIADYVIVAGGIEHTRRQSEFYAKKAINILDTFENSFAKSSLIGLVNYSINRNS